MALSCQQFAHAIAEVSLQLKGAVSQRSARTTTAFQLLRQRRRERRVVRKSIDHGDRLSAAPRPLDSQLEHEARGNSLVFDRLLRGAAAGGRRPPALGAHATLLGLINDAR